MDLKDAIATNTNNDDELEINGTCCFRFLMYLRRFPRRGWTANLLIYVKTSKSFNGHVTQKIKINPLSIVYFFG